MNNKAVLIGMRCLAVGMMGFALLFGGSWDKSGYSWGDAVFQSLGLSPWSNGMSGTHYTAVLAIIILLGGFFLFAATTKKWGQTFRYLLVGSIVILVVLNLLSVTL